MTNESNKTEYFIQQRDRHLRLTSVYETELENLREIRRSILEEQRIKLENNDDLIKNKIGLIEDHKILLAFYQDAIDNS